MLRNSADPPSPTVAKKIMEQIELREYNLPKQVEKTQRIDHRTSRHLREKDHKKIESSGVQFKPFSTEWLQATKTMQH